MHLGENMTYPINYPTPSNADVQVFIGSGSTFNTNARTRTWNKPQGASFVWFTLIGAGGNGSGSNPGGSGAVTNCLVPAFLLPDSLSISVGQVGSQMFTRVNYVNKATYVLFQANPGSFGTGGAASTTTSMGAAGFFQSVAGMASGTTTPSPTTFLSAGDSTALVPTANYGYSVGTFPSSNGFFQFQPIMVGVGGGTGGSGSGNAGIGCGASINGTSSGGPGAVVIISW